MQALVEAGLPVAAVISNRAAAAGPHFARSPQIVTAELDSGPIVIQAALRVAPQEQPAELAARVLRQEHVIYPRAARWFLEDKLVIRDGVVRVKGDDAQLVLAAD